MTSDTRLVGARSIPDLFVRRARIDPLRIDAYTREQGRWVGRTWGDAEQRVRRLAAGLAGLGFGTGDRGAVLAQTSAEWMLADMAIMARGGVTVGIYPTCTVDQVRYHLEHSGASVVFVDDAAQLAKVEAAREGLGDLEVIATRPLDGVRSLAELEADGAGRPEAEPSRFDEVVAGVGPDDLCTIVYTSGTTGPPKGAMLTHGNLLSAAFAALEVLPIGPDDVSLIFLPLAHSLQREAGVAGIIAGATGAFATSIDRFLDELQEVRPTAQASVPRIWEKLHTRIHSRIEESPPHRQRIARWAFGVAERHGRLRRAGEPIPRSLRAQYRVADRVVFTKLREVFGGRARYMVSGGAPIAVELLELFDSIGIRIYEGWGLTETAAPHTVNGPKAWRFGTVGRPMPGMKVRIAEDGEIEAFGPNVFVGYYRDEAATSEAFTDDGWFRTGDIGELDDDGFLRITDRKKELIITSGGKNVAPQNIEGLLKRDPFISQAVVIGDRRKFLSALVTLDPEEIVPWARSRGLPEDPAELAAHPDVRAHVQGVVDAANAELARFEQVREVRVLHRDLDQEHDEITPTLKLKRRVVAEHFADVIESIYGP